MSLNFSRAITTFLNSPKSMKRVLFVTIVFLVSGLCAFAQDGKKMAVGLGLEWDMNARENFAAGAVLSFDYAIFRSFAAGVSVTYSHNFSNNMAIEPAALFRWYFLEMGNIRFFAQADAGAFLFMEDGETSPMFQGGLRVGLRLPVGQRFYVEPFGRGGYPFAFGVGVAGGVRF